MDTPPIYLFEFADEVLVECPGCGGCATVECRGARHATPKLSCVQCGLTKRGWPPPSRVEIRRSARGRCPRCQESLGKAPVRYLARKRQVEILCPCGAVSLGALPSSSIRAGDATDPYFGIPLWFRGSAAGKELWAYNRRHLAFLESYVRATARQRTLNRNGSLASRLPRWIKSAARRDEILKAVARIANRTE